MARVGGAGMRQPRVSSCAGISAAATANTPRDLLARHFYFPRTDGTGARGTRDVSLGFRLVCRAAAYTVQPGLPEARALVVSIFGPGWADAVPVWGFAGGARRVAVPVTVRLGAVWRSRLPRAGKTKPRDEADARPRQSSSPGRPVRHPYRMATYGPWLRLHSADYRHAVAHLW
jgi:hypothetical protein